MVAGGGFSPTPQQSVPTDIPTLTPRVTLEPEAFQGRDAGTMNTVTVRAAEGGQFTLSDGTKVVIPAGALPRDTEISVVVPTQRQDPHFFQYIFKPSGLVFSTPIFVVVPHSLPDPQVLFAFDSSPANPMVADPSEPNNWKKTTVVAADETSLTLALEHFTFMWALVNGDKSCYVVCDIPYRYLKPADAVFYLTGGIANASWHVGHVGILTKKTGEFANKTEDNMVHSSGETPVSVVSRSASEVALIDGHIYLGARRAKKALTDTDVSRMMTFLNAQLGKDYSLIGDAGLPTDVFFDAWSCVGLVEYAFHLVGKDNLSFFRRDFISTPMELFRAMDPVEEIEVEAGVALEIPVYVTAQLAEEYINVLTAAYSRFPDAAPYTFENTQLPPGAVLEEAGLIADENRTRAPGRLFKWTPESSQIGQTFNVTFTARTLRTGVLGVQHRGQNSYTLRMKVISADWKVIYEQIAEDPSQEFGDVAITTNGSYAFALGGTFENSTNNKKDIYAKLNDDPLVLIDTVFRKGVDQEHRQGFVIFRDLVMNENAELVYLGETNMETGLSEFRFKHPGLPVETLGPFYGNVTSLLPIDGNNQAILFIYQGNDMASLDVRHPASGPSPLGLKQLSGQNFNLVRSFSVNSSGSGFASGYKSEFNGNTFEVTSTSFRYQYPVDQTPASADLIFPMQQSPINYSYTVNEQGDFAYIQGTSGGIDLVIERKNKPLLRVTGLNIQTDSLKMNVDGDLFAMEFATNGFNLLRFPYDNTPQPEVLNGALPLQERTIWAYDVAGTYLAITTKQSVLILQKGQSGR
ncbi:MAG: hypothetical protein KF760_25345 [Candidatus Eremiobacteraeota bacterium]|nr:hypothetical protein [Candidatus Eremiobacteraeota bacterium]